MKQNKSKNKSKVSIIITVKNGKLYLKECLNSILKQTLKDIEVVVIYAPSTDKTMEILEEYKNKDSRIVLYPEETKGIGAAKNTGINKSTGEFITFLDSDAYYMDTDALEAMYNAAKSHNVKICGALRSIKKINGEIEKLSLHRAFLIGFPNGRLFDYKDVQYDYHFHSYLYDRDMIINSDARFAELRVFDDTHFHIRAMNNAGKFYVVPKELYCYRLHEAYDWKDDLCQDALKGLLDELKYTSENNLDMCHYYAFQRCSYEFGDLLKKYAEQGDWQLIELFRLQGEVRNDLIESALKKNINLNIINPMLYTNNEVKYKDILGVKTYLITPLYDLIADREHINYKGEYMSIKKDYEQLENENNGIKKEYEQLENENKRIKKEYEQLENENKYNKEEYENIANSKTYKVGQKVVWLPKKILKFLHIRK